MAAKMKYLELSNAQIADKRRLVISECIKENQESKEKIQCGFTLAQQVEVEEGKRMTRVFLKMESMLQVLMSFIIFVMQLMMQLTNMKKRKMMRKSGKIKYF